MDKISVYKKSAIFIIFFGLLFCINILVYNKCTTTFRISVSAIDGATALFVYNNCYFGIIVPFTVTITYITRSQLVKSSNIALFKSRRNFLNRLVIKGEQTILHVIWFSMLLNFAEYLLLSERSLNWSEPSSLFYRAVEAECSGPDCLSYLIISLILTFVYAFLKLSVIYLAAILIEILFNSSSMVILLLFAFSEYTAFFGNNIIGKYSSVKDFYCNTFVNHVIWKEAAVYFLLYAVLCFLTQLVFNRKDLLK